MGIASIFLKFPAHRCGAVRIEDVFHTSETLMLLSTKGSREILLLLGQPREFGKP